MKLLSQRSILNKNDTNCSFNNQFDLDENMEDEFENLNNQLASVYIQEARSMNLSNI